MSIKTKMILSDGNVQQPGRKSTTEQEKRTKNKDTMKSTFVSKEWVLGRLAPFTGHYNDLYHLYNDIMKDTLTESEINRLVMEAKYFAASNDEDPSLVQQAPINLNFYVTEDKIDELTNSITKKIKEV